MLNPHHPTTTTEDFHKIVVFSNVFTHLPSGGDARGRWPPGRRSSRPSADRKRGRRTSYVSTWKASRTHSFPPKPQTGRAAPYPHLSPSLTQRAKRIISTLRPETESSDRRDSFFCRAAGSETSREANKNQTFCF